MHADIDFDPHHAADVQSLIDAWLPLTFAVNSLNRSMGLADLYPFVLSPAVIEKLRFIHATVRAGAQPAVPDKRACSAWRAKSSYQAPQAKGKATFCKK